MAKFVPLGEQRLTTMLEVAAKRLDLPLSTARVQYGTLNLSASEAAVYAWEKREVHGGRSVIVDESGESLRLPSNVLYQEHVARFKAGERG